MSGSLRLAGTHGYPGCPVSADGPDLTSGDVVVAFSDGTEAPATLTADGPHPVLAIARFTTARGTQVAAKRWRLARGGTSWKIAERLD